MQPTFLFSGEPLCIAIPLGWQVSIMESLSIIFLPNLVCNHRKREVPHLVPILTVSPISIFFCPSMNLFPNAQGTRRYQLGDNLLFLISKRLYASRYHAGDKFPSMSSLQNPLCNLCWWREVPLRWPPSISYFLYLENLWRLCNAQCTVQCTVCMAIPLGWQVLPSSSVLPGTLLLSFTEHTDKESFSFLRVHYLDFNDGT